MDGAMVLDGPIQLFAKVLIMNNELNVLVIRRSETAPHGALMWDLPGGLIHYGEDPTRAALRETVEETGIVLDEARILAVTSAVAGLYVIKFTYYALVGVPQVRLSREHDRYKWVSLDEIEALKIPQAYKVDAQRLKRLLAEP